MPCVRWRRARRAARAPRLLHQRRLQAALRINQERRAGDHALAGVHARADRESVALLLGDLDGPWLEAPLPEVDEHVAVEPRIDQRITRHEHELSARSTRLEL